MARKKAAEDGCEANVKRAPSGMTEQPCQRGGFCNDVSMYPGCVNGGGAAADQPTEIQPGERVVIEFGRLDSGEWYGQIGNGEEEDQVIAQTSAFPWEVLRGLAAQVKKQPEFLAQHRALALPDDMGGCPHASQDGTRCELLQSPIGGAEAVVRMLREARAVLLYGAPAPSGLEIVRLYGVMKEPRLVGKGEDEGDVLTAVFEVAGDDLTPQFRYLRPSAKKQVVAIVYHAYAPPSAAKRDQLDMFHSTMEGGDHVTCCPEKTAPVEETKPEEVPAEQPAAEGEPTLEPAEGEAGGPADPPAEEPVEKAA